MIEKEKNKLSDSLEDYLEVIFKLCESKGGIARSKDIAEMLEVAKPSVTGALKQLSDRGLVNYEPYGYVTLTKEGRVSAKGIAEKHRIICSFLVDVLGVSHEIADEAACKAEHSFGKTVINRLYNFSQFLKHKKTNGYNIIDEFEDFLSS